MGTTALFVPIDIDGEEVCTIYIQSDGYPMGVPYNVAEFLARKKIVNGIRVREAHKIFNGMDDLASQLVAFLKNMLGVWYVSWFNIINKLSKDTVFAGFVYIMPPKTRDVDEHYIYYIYPKDKDLDGGTDVMIEAVAVDFENGERVERIIFRGTASEYVKHFSPK